MRPARRFRREALLGIITLPRSVLSDQLSIVEAAYSDEERREVHSAVVSALRDGLAVERLTDEQVGKLGVPPRLVFLFVLELLASLWTERRYGEVERLGRDIYSLLRAPTERAAVAAVVGDAIWTQHRAAANHSDPCDPAVEWFRTAATATHEVTQQTIGSRLVLGYLLLLSGREQEAEDCYRQTVERTLDDVPDREFFVEEARLGMGIAALLRGDVHEAEAPLRSYAYGSRANPSWVDAALVLRQLYEDTGRRAEGDRLLAGLLEGLEATKNPEERRNGYLSLALHAANRGEAQACRGLVRRASDAEKAVGSGSGVVAAYLPVLSRRLAGLGLSLELSASDEDG